MEAKVTHSAGRIYQARRFDMVLGQVYDVELTGIDAPIEWTAGPDEVLSISESGGLNARITATAVGSSILRLFKNERPVGVLRIGVYEEPTVLVEFSFGSIRPVDVE